MNIQETRQVLSRGLRLKCPACGETALFWALFQMRSCCTYCGLVFEREQGYFVGAIYVNVIRTEGLLLGIYLVSLSVTPTISQSLVVTLLVLAAVLPLLFYHHSRSLWLSFDYLVTGPEKE